MARALLALTVLAACLPVSLPLSSFANECGDGSNAESEGSKDIHILGFIPCSQPKGDVSGCPVRPPQLEGTEDSTFDVCCWVDDIPILAMTLDQINSDPTLLPGYRLVLDNVKSGCGNALVSTVTLHDSIAETLQGDGPVHHMILGPACTVATEPVAELSGKYLNINQVSYTASGTQFKDRDLFPRLYTLQPIVFSYNDAYVHLIQSFGWKRVAIINEVDPLFSATATDLRDKLNAANITVEHLGSFDSDPSQQLEIIKEMDLRIIIALFIPHTSLARKLWCEAVRQGLADHLHVWFTPVWATLNLNNKVPGSCTNEELRGALAHTFGVLGSDFVVEEDSSTELVSGQTAHDFYNQLQCYKSAFDQKYNDLAKVVDVTLKEGYVYDSIWAIALALNRTIQRGIALENFTYDNDTIADIMQEELRNSNFFGISGQVIFTANSSKETGFRKDPFLEIRQYNETGVLKLRGIYDTHSDRIIREETSFSWPAEGLPADGPTPTLVPYPLWSVLIVSIIAGIGMVCAIICLAVTLAYRKHKAFKMSTFRLNAIICIGIFLGFFGDFLSAHSVRFFLENVTAMEIISNLANWLYHISFVLTFGSLLMKTWRIYRIFCNPALRKRKFLDDKYLMLAVGAMLAFDVVVLTVWTGVVHVRWIPREYEDPADRTKKFVVYSTAGGNLYGAFLGVLVVAYVMLLLFGMFMAYQIKQNIRSFYNKYNDSPIVNLSSLLALTVSFGSLSVFLIVTPTAETIGFLLLVFVLRDGVWMFPMLGFMYLPMIFELVREKYTGKSIIRRGSVFSARRFSIDPDSHARRTSSVSLSSYAMDDAHRRMSLEASPSQSRRSSSSFGDGTVKVNPRPLSPLKEEGAESMPGESAHRKASYDVAQASSNIDDDEVFAHQYIRSEVRRPSILKIPPSADGSPEERRGSHHVQFTESQQTT